MRRLWALAVGGPTSVDARWPLLQRVRWRFVLLNLVGVVLAPLTVPYLVSASVVAMVGYLAVMVLLGCWAVALYRRAARTALLNAAGPMLIGLLGVVAGDAAWAFGPLFAALFLHSLYGQRRAVLRRAAGYFLAYEIATLVTGGTDALLGPQLLSMGLGLAIVSLVMLEMGRSLRSGDEVRRRDERVAAATQLLLRADSPEAVGDVVATAVHELLGDLMPVAPEQVTVWREEPDGMVLLAAHGAPVRVRQMPLAAIDPMLLDGYHDGGVVRLTPAHTLRMARAAGMEEAPTHGLALPLVGINRVIGAVFVRSSHRVPDAALVALHRFTDEASMALTVVRQNRMLHEVIANSADGIVLVDDQLRLRFTSRALDELCGREVVLGHHLGEVLGVAPAGRAVADLDDLRAHADRLVVRAVDGDRPVEVACREVAGEGTVFNVRDVTQQRQLQDEIRHRAYHDALTGLPNRAHFLERLERALTRWTGADGAVGVALFDLDDFKTVNDEHGHLAGDRVLAALARRVRERLRTDDLFARLGGDEFALLVERADGDDAVLALAQDLLETIREPVDVDGVPVVVSSSSGLVVLDGPVAVEAVLGNADAAMYAAKSAGKGDVVRFDAPLRERVAERRRLRDELACGIGAGQLRVHYQPMLALDDERLVGVEALVRWQHPTRGLLAPDVFIPVAEESGLIGELGHAVLEQAAGDLADWIADGRVDTEFQIHVNLSARQLGEPGLPDAVGGLLDRLGLDPARLVLEITETALAQDPETAEATLRRLAALGVTIAIDDFGTGYASFTYLRRFPVSVVKVDRSFVADVLDGPEAAGLSHAIIRMAQNLGLATVAEGIEVADARDLLAQWGCERGQGWLWSRALPAEELLGWLAVRQQEPAAVS